MTREVKLVSNLPDGRDLHGVGIRIPLKAALLSDVIKMAIGHEAHTVVFAIPATERELRAFADWCINHQHDDPPMLDYHQDIDVIPACDLQIFNIIPPKQLLRTAEALGVPGLQKLCELLSAFDDKFNGGSPYNRNLN